MKTYRSFTFDIVLFTATVISLVCYYRNVPHALQCIVAPLVVGAIGRIYKKRNSRP